LDHLRSYRCTYVPLSRDGVPFANDTGVLPAVQVLSTDAEAAQRQAHAVTGKPIAQVDRLDEERAPTAWPVTRRSLDRLRVLVREASDIAAAIRDSGPVGVRFEASNLLAGVADLDELVRDLSAALDGEEG
jgi:hypothetical protein